MCVCVSVCVYSICVHVWRRVNVPVSKDCITGTPAAAAGRHQWHGETHVLAHVVTNSLTDTLAYVYKSPRDKYKCAVTTRRLARAHVRSPSAAPRLIHSPSPPDVICFCFVCFLSQHQLR